MRNSSGMHLLPRSASNVHPEFGYLCASGRIRRRIRLAATCATIAALSGFLFLFVVAGRSADARDQALASAQSERFESEFALAAFQSGTMGATAAGAERSASPARAACDDLVNGFLDRSCRTSEHRRRHGERSNHRVATVVIGRADAPSPAADAEVQTAAADSQAAVAPSEAEAVPAPVKRTASTAAKPKIAHAPKLMAAPAVTSASAYADDPRASRTPPRDAFPFPLGNGLFGSR